MKNLFEIRQFEGTGLDLWKERMQGILFLKDCDKALEAEKPKNMSEDAWRILNKKAVTYIKMVVSDETLVDLKGLVFASKIWAKLKATYENIMHVNQVHLLLRNQCGKKGHKKPNCCYYKAKLERKKNSGDKKKDKTDTHDSQKEDGLNTLIKVHTTQNPTDVLTKCLPKAQHQICIQMVGVM